MNKERDIDLVNDLIARPAETTWVEFKRNNTDQKMIGVRCSALSNAARIDGSRIRREVITLGRLQGTGKRSKQDIADYVLIRRTNNMPCKKPLPVNFRN